MYSGIISDITLEGSFERKGIIVTLPPVDLNNIEEISVDDAIEAGAEEVSSLDEDKNLTVGIKVQFRQSKKSKSYWKTFCSFTYEIYLVYFSSFRRF